MIIELQGSKLTQAILELNENKVWCAVSNISDEHAMSTIDKGYYELLVHIVAFDDGFICDKGDVWKHAVSVKKVQLTQDEVGL